MYIYNSKTFKFLTYNNQKLAETKRADYNFSTKEILEIPFNKNYKYYGVVHPDNFNEIMNYFRDNGLISKKAKIPDIKTGSIPLNIKQTTDYVYIPVTFTIGILKRFITIKNTKLDIYKNESLETFVMFNERLFIIPSENKKLYTIYNCMFKKYKNLTKLFVWS